MRRILIFLFLALCLGCKNAIPQVGFLHAPVSTPESYHTSAADVRNSAGPVSVTSTSGSKGLLLLHSGTAQRAKTGSGYTLQVRSISF